MSLNVKRLVRCAMIAAVYVVLCLVLAPLSYGTIQIRVAEALTLLPVFGPEYIIAVTLGCLLANLLGSTMVDVIFGTLATLLACLVTYALRKIRIRGLAIPASIPPVLSNAVIVGAIELTFFMGETGATAKVALLNALSVGLGEVVSCMILGVMLVKLIESVSALSRIFISEEPRMNP